ncbi:MAG: guanylate kinase [Candidatus Marinimicrobia bacterium]|nr:guanylate kinase [Candidatus Neomarinimicrobiota bacterium]
MINIICISAPSGSGKTTLCRALQKEHPEVKWSVSRTTRPPRPFEVNGVDYVFISHDEFEGKIDAGEFAEYEDVHGEYYGTLKTTLDNTIGAESFLLLELDVKGSMSIKKLYPNNTFLIFILPPSMDHLRDRLRKRGADSEERIEKRLQRFEEELGYKDKFDYILINEDVQDATQELLEVVNQLNTGVLHGT